jgi:diguanylate cyclase (GGDEF)-like protein
VSQDGGAEVRSLPREALGPVQRALISVHAAVGLRATLHAVAKGVTVSTPYQEVAVTIAEEPNATELRTIEVIGSAEARAALLDTTCRRDALLEHLALGEAWGSLRFRSGSERTEGIITHTLAYEVPDIPDAWLPEYELNAPLYEPDGELVGMLSMDTPLGGRIPPAWVNEVLELFAEQAVIAILNARRHERALQAMQRLERERAELRAEFGEQCARETDLRRETRRDALTGLANRVLLQERLEELLAAQIPVAIVFCDLDRFKQINDAHGHAVGDEVLRTTGRRLADGLAHLEVVARIGGDEFVLVAARARQADAPSLLQTIDRTFTGAPMVAGGLHLPVTASMGLVYEPARPENRHDPGRRVEELLRVADRQMYAHKRSRAGVNRLLTLARPEAAAKTPAEPAAQVQVQAPAQDAGAGAGQP